MTDALQEATFYLNFGQIRVDRRTDVGNSDVVYDIHLAGFLVELDFYEGCEVGWRRFIAREGLCCLNCLSFFATVVVERVITEIV